MSETLVGRLAPSPTGAQHVGNARTYLLAWLAVRSRGGRIILRIEDIDSPRIKPHAAEQAVDDLRWLGLDWDEGPDVGGPHGPYVQTERLALYQQALEQLRAAGRIYPCTCSRSDVLAAASAPHLGQDAIVYPGTCRPVARDAKANAALSYSWRYHVLPGDRQFHDHVAGLQVCRTADELGDFVVARHDGAPAYQLAVVVDDHAMGVTQVVRGDDLLPSAFRQLELYGFFGWQPPEFAHVPLVVGPDGRRLAKRHGDTRLSLLREAGVPPERLVGLLAWSCGLRPMDAPVAAGDLVEDFSLDRVSQAPFVFTETMFGELNNTSSSSSMRSTRT